MAKLNWEPQANEALRTVPFFVRPMVRRKVEEIAIRNGRFVVILSDFREAHARYRAATAGKSSEELKQMLPQENTASADLVIVEACRSELTGCPNALISTSNWHSAISSWTRESNLSEKLRERVTGDRVLFHHKLRVSIAGCPNGCSRPQIADLALVGSVCPGISPEACTLCGACAAACPDSSINVDGAAPVFDGHRCQGCTSCRDACQTGSITLSPPNARILMGGKLGRHPHLAEEVGTATTPADAIAAFDQIVNRYLHEARPGERFAAWFVRSRRSATNR